jgi:hypothetical protein
MSLKRELLSAKTIAAARPGEPPQATSDVTVSEDALALRFAETHAAADWGKRERSARRIRTRHRYSIRAGSHGCGCGRGL